MNAFEIKERHQPAPSNEREASESSFAQRVEHAFIEGRARIVGTGSTGDVRIIAAKETGAELPWVVKTRTAEPPSHTKNRRTFKTEWTMHQKAYSIVTEVGKDPRRKYAMIPQPIASIESEHSHRVILEYLDGETLFERAIRFTLLRYADEDDAEKIKTMNREELVALATSPAYIDVFPENVQHDARWALKQPSSTIPPLTEEDFSDIVDVGQKNHNGTSLLSRAQYLQLEATVELLHARGIAHGDLHPSNIMMLRDGTMAIIDFGLSKQVSTPTHKQCKEDLAYLSSYKKLL